MKLDYKGINIFYSQAGKGRELRHHCYGTKGAVQSARVFSGSSNHQGAAPCRTFRFMDRAVKTGSNPRYVIR